MVTFVWLGKGSQVENPKVVNPKICNPWNLQSPTQKTLNTSRDRRGHASGWRVESDRSIHYNETKYVLLCQGPLLYWMDSSTSILLSLRTDTKDSKNGGMICVFLCIVSHDMFPTFVGLTRTTRDFPNDPLTTTGTSFTTTSSKITGVHTYRPPRYYCTRDLNSPSTRSHSPSTHLPVDTMSYHPLHDLSYYSREAHLPSFPSKGWVSTWGWILRRKERWSFIREHQTGRAGWWGSTKDSVW